MDLTTELEIEIAALRKKIIELEEKNTSLTKILVENGIEEVVIPISDEEAICLNEIKKLKVLSDNGQFGKEEAQILDILHKNLRTARGQAVEPVPKSKKKVDVGQLFKIVQDGGA